MKKTFLASLFLIGSFTAMSYATPVPPQPNAAPSAPAPVAVVKPDRSAPPAVGSPRPLTLPPIQKFALQNGIPVWFAVSNRVPLASMALMIKSGTNADPKGKEGLASFTANLLDDGCQEYDSLQFSSEIDLLGAYFSVESDKQSTQVSVTVPVQRLEKAINLTSAALMAPSFSQQEIDRRRKEGLTAAQQHRRSPASLANAAFLYEIFPTGSRQQISALGTPESFSKLTRRDLQAFYTKHYRPENCSIVVTGDVNPQQVLALLNKNLGAWKPAKFTEAMKKTLGERAPEPLHVSSSLMARRTTEPRPVYVVDRPGSPQSVIRIGRVAVDRFTPFYFPLQVLNAAFGGSFTSRLNTNLREKHGYTYGASSRFSFGMTPGPFYMAADVQADKTLPAIQEMLKETEKMRQPLTEDELAKARNYIGYRYPQSFETCGRLANRLLEMQLYNLPDNYFDKYVPEIMAVSEQATLKPRELFFNPETMKIVVVGDAAVIEKQVAEVPGWKVERLDIDTFWGKNVPIK